MGFARRLHYFRNSIINPRITSLILGLIMLFSPWMGLINFRSWGRAKRTLSLRKRMGIEWRGSGQAPLRRPPFDRRREWIHPPSSSHADRSSKPLPQLRALRRLQPRSGAPRAAARNKKEARRQQRPTFRCSRTRAEEIAETRAAALIQ